MPTQNGDLLCADGKTVYAPDRVMKLQVVRELAIRAIAEDLQRRDCLTSPGKYRVMVDCYVKNATEHLEGAAARIEESRGGTVIPFSTISPRPNEKGPSKR